MPFIGKRGTSHKAISARVRLTFAMAELRDTI